VVRIGLVVSMLVVLVGSSLVEVVPLFGVGRFLVLGLVLVELMLEVVVAVECFLVGIRRF